ncbi:MAG TPA: hypothetical protein VMT27_03095, partial [Actinomycetes bacterium]|nr:hypothetical protein [Actinomycetes bacterium]
GPNMPTRIQGTAQLMLEPGEVAPSLPWYQPLVPFYPPSITSGSDSSSTTADGHKLWERTPSRCDLLFYQGDDIVIPLYFNDPSLADDDMSLHEWHAQIRVLHRYQSRLVADFVTTASFHTGTDETDEYTMVELFLPRSDNLYYGQYRWDLYSISDADLSRFPKPEDVLAADWPPPDALRTWLYGIATIAPRVTDTDFLFGSSNGGLVPYPGPPPYVTVMTTGGWCVGPNGRVP